MHMCQKQKRKTALGKYPCRTTDKEETKAQTAFGKVLLQGTRNKGGTKEQTAFGMYACRATDKGGTKAQIAFGKVLMQGTKDKEGTKVQTAFGKASLHSIKESFDT